MAVQFGKVLPKPMSNDILPKSFKEFIPQIKKRNRKKKISIQILYRDLIVGLIEDTNIKQTIILKL